jgi:hypothetical protein
MKPEKAATNTASSIPAVTTPPAPVQDFDNEHVISLINDRFRVTPERIGMCLDYMRAEDKSNIPFAVEMLTTGSRQARQLAHEAFYLAIVDMEESHESLEREDDEFWYEKCPGSWKERLHPRMTQAWCLGNVVDEANLSAEINALKMGEVIMSASDYHHNALSETQHGTTPPLVTDRDYWRGVSALTLAYGKAEYSTDALEFAEWASHHDNLALIIETSKERKTINVETLKSIVERDEISTSLRVGIL